MATQRYALVVTKKNEADKDGGSRLGVMYRGNNYYLYGYKQEDGTPRFVWWNYKGYLREAPDVTLPVDWRFATLEDKEMLPAYVTLEVERHITPPQ